MTAGRRQRKPGWLSAFLLISASLMVSAGMSSPGRTATTERIVTDWHTGLAISGFDPVAYFVDAAAKPGRREIELRLAGTTWLFRNDGNRAAFASDPDVYMPRFGGYDPTAMARGVALPGHPDLWAIAKRRLYLFYTAAARDAFIADPDAVAEAAEEKWPDVQRVLVP